MGKRVVDDASLALVADAIREYSNIGEPICFPDDFAAGVADANSLGFDTGLRAGLDSGDAILSNADIGDYYNDRITKLRTYAFYYCSSIKTAELPNVLECGYGSLCKCDNLEKVKLQSLKNIYVSALMADCPKLEFVDLGPTGSVGSTTFKNDVSLKTIILRKDTSPAVLQNLNSFAGTPYAEGGSGGRIYVPSALIEQYETATNWSVLCSYGTLEFAALEGSGYE